jgi:hypothetical protein
MADSRVLLVRQAFNSMSDAGRPVPLDTLRMRYNAKMHPDVRSGKRTQVDVLREFLESCDIGHDGEVRLQLVSTCPTALSYFCGVVWCFVVCVLLINFCASLGLVAVLCVGFVEMVVFVALRVRH